MKCNQKIIVHRHKERKKESEAEKVVNVHVQKVLNQQNFIAMYTSILPMKGNTLFRLDTMILCKVAVHKIDVPYS